MLEISPGDFREQIELAGIQESDAADMLSICLLGYRTMDLGIVANPSIPLHLKISVFKGRGLYPWAMIKSSVLVILTHEVRAVVFKEKEKKCFWCELDYTALNGFSWIHNLYSYGLSDF